MRYKRILLKLSGGAVSGNRDFGFDPEALEYIADEILTLYDAGIEVGMVIGGGNIFRGSLGAQWGIDRSEADNIGMLKEYKDQSKPVFLLFLDKTEKEKIEGPNLPELRKQISALAPPAVE